jgi:hypothetical protein
MFKHRFLILLIALYSVLLFVSRAKGQFPWPVTPFNSTQEITGNFCEFRDTGSADHFHNGTDIPKADGSPVYPVRSGIVTSLSRSGSNAFVRVQDKAYVHISPALSLEVGDSVWVSQTILGTILPGLGHVHFTNGFVGSERNSMLLGTGLTPLDDPWAPIIRYIRFYRNSSTRQLTGGKVGGRVDIVVKVDEQNGPPSSRLSRRNNGTYKIGYKILSADTSSVVLEPPNAGVRFQFNTKPSNSHVHNVFFDQLSSTTSHVYIVTNNISSNGFWDTASLAPGKYVVMAFAEDTRQNSDTLYAAVEVLAPPAPPVLSYVRSDETRLEVAWLPGPGDALSGFRLYFSIDNVNWTLRLDETNLTGAKTNTSFSVSLGRDIYFRLTGVDAFGSESIQTDVYGSSNVNPDQGILLVDGFDRTEAGGSWQGQWHDFSVFYGQAIAANGFGFDAVSNDALLEGGIRLSDYDAVIWFLGDESANDETFSIEEQQLVTDFLRNGGMLFVSGSEIAWDLDRDSDSPGATEADEEFLHEFLRVDYVGNNAGISTALGVGGTIFESLNLEFGNNPYPEDSPDFVNPFGAGAMANLIYRPNQIAGVQYEGTFAGGTTPGRLVYLGFPFETISGEGNRTEVMARILKYFFPTTSVDDHSGTTARDFALLQNFPNPFNPETVIPYVLPVPSHVDVTIFDSRGQTVRELVHEKKSAGSFEESWDGLDDQGFLAASGNYFVRLRAISLNFENSEQYEKTISITLVR